MATHGTYAVVVDNQVADGEDGVGNNNLDQGGPVEGRDNDGALGDEDGVDDNNDGAGGDE